MSKYYCLIAELPEITIESSKAPFSVEEFRSETADILTAKDRALFDWLYYRYDNANLLNSLRTSEDKNFDSRAVYSAATLKELCSIIKEEEGKPVGFPVYVPDYFVRFILEYNTRLENRSYSDNRQLLEDRLSSMYFNEAMSLQNDFLSSWFELNLNICNIMTVVNCRRYGYEKRDYIVGENTVAEQLRHSGSREINLDETDDYIKDTCQIANEPELLLREKRLDALRWRWLEESTIFKTFDIENVITYMLHIQIVERWARMDRTNGEQTFRRLTEAIKEQGVSSLSVLQN
jgi:hypothetical protein